MLTRDILSPHMNLDASRRWWAFAVLCLGDLMIVLDMTVVNVALPSIKTDLGFSDASLVWVVNAYLLTFGGFLLLGGRLGDLYGQRRLFIAGLTVFTLASLACGLADSQTTLIVARAIQGIGGAIASAIALSLVINIFTDHRERARARDRMPLRRRRSKTPHLCAEPHSPRARARRAVVATVQSAPAGSRSAPSAPRPYQPMRTSERRGGAQARRAR